MTDFRYSNQEYEACEVCTDAILLVAEGTWVMQGPVVCEECAMRDQLSKQYMKTMTAEAKLQERFKPRAVACRGCGELHAVAHDAPDNTPCYACHMEREYELAGGRANYEHDLNLQDKEYWEL